MQKRLLNKKIISLLFLSFSLPTFAAQTEVTKCGKNDLNTESCFHFLLSLPDYSYPWLKAFAIQKTFARENIDPHSVSLQRLAEEKVIANLENAYSTDSYEHNYWHEAQINGDFLVLKRERNSFSGGAQRWEDVLYYVFERSTGKIIPTTGIILPQKEEALQKLLQQHLAIWILTTEEDYSRDNISPADIARVKDSFAEFLPLPIPENWTLGQNTIIFRYLQGDSTPFPEQEIILSLPVVELEKIIRPHILQAAKNWPEKAE